MNIDVNEIGRNGYKLLRSMKVIPDKSKKDLTLNETEELINTLYEILNSTILKIRTVQSRKYEFLSYLYLSVILYLDNMDLNKYISIEANTEELQDNIEFTK